METVDGYQQLVLLLLLVAYLQPVQLPQELQQHNAKLGDQHAYQMEQLVYQNQHVHHTLHKLHVETLVAPIKKQNSSNHLYFIIESEEFYSVFES